MKIKAGLSSGRREIGYRYFELLKRDVKTRACLSPHAPNGSHMSLLEAVLSWWCSSVVEGLLSRHEATGSIPYTS